MLFFFVFLSAFVSAIGMPPAFVAIVVMRFLKHCHKVTKTQTHKDSLSNFHTTSIAASLQHHNIFNLIPIEPDKPGVP